MLKTRTGKSIKNAQVALGFYIVNLLLTFVSRKAFIDYLGAEVLGLNTTATNLLEFLHLAELGVTSAISYTLYKPLFENNKKAINEIVSIQGWLYRKIAFVIIIGSCILMCFFPLFFRKMELPLWYAYGSFSVLLMSSLLSYFVNYRQIVLTADQKGYKVTFNVQGGKILKVVLQIIAIMFLANGYIYWLIIELMMSVLIAITLNITLYKEYPWLQTSSSEGRYLKKKYPEIITRTKQLFFHKIASFALTQTSPLIIYAYASLTIVAVYSNYMLIIAGAVLLINSLFNSVGAGIGNLVAEGNEEKVKSFYWECISVRYWGISIICYGIYMLSHSFIRLWIGAEYTLPQLPFILLIIYTFIIGTRVNDLFLSAYGMYQDIWAPVTEAAINIGFSILLGYYWGLTGVILGVVLSLFLVVFCWKPYFLFRYGFKSPIRGYTIRLLKYFTLMALSFMMSSALIGTMADSDIRSYMNWAGAAIKYLFIYSMIISSLFLLFDSSFRKFSYRIIHLIIN